MINRRTVRPSRGVENLQQMCLNSSAGIDCTTPHSDAKSVYMAKNLVNNADGSLSLRKPIVLRQQWNKDIVKTIPTGIDDVALNILTEGNQTSFWIRSTYSASYMFGTMYPFNLIWRDYTGVEHTVVCGPTSTGTRRLYSSVIDFTNAVPVHIGNGNIVLGNCMVNLFAERMTDSSTDPEAKLCDKSLYPTSSTTYYRPRYVQVEYVPGTALQTDIAWNVRLVSPEVNEYLVTKDSVFHDKNTLLDNPFAVRDTCDAAAAAVKTIRAYVKSDVVNGRAVPVQNSTTPASKLSHAITPPIWSNSSRNLTIASDVQYGGTSVDYFNYTFGNAVNEDAVVLSNWNVNLYSSASKTSLSVFMSKNEQLLNTFMRLDVPIRVTGTQRESSYARGDSFWIGDTTGPNNNWLDVSGVTLSIKSKNTTFTKTFSKSEFKTYEIPSVVATGNFKTTGNIRIDSNISTGDRAKLFSVLHEENVVEVTLKFTNFTVFVMSHTNTDSFETLKVRGLTESTTPIRYRAAVTVTPDVSAVVLKAFMSLPKDTSMLYCSWRYSTDGVSWAPVLNAYETTGTVNVKEPSTAPIESVEATVTESETAYTYRPLGNPSPDTLCVNRGDCIYLSHRAEDDFEYWNGALFKFKVCALDVSGSAPKITATYGEEVYVLPIRAEFEAEESDVGNTAFGDKRYINKRLFSFGDSLFKNNVFYSYPGEFTTPLTNAISLSSSADDIVTSVSAWRNYIISTTPHAMYLSTPAENGYFTKTVNTAIGVPVLDKRCVSTVPTGVIFKSGAKIYILYPNAYASDDTFMNVADISKQISHILEEYTYDDTYLPFSFTTSSEYVLMLPMQDKTLSLKYDLDTHRWSVSEYPTIFTDVSIVSLDDIRIYGVTKISGNYCICEYVYDADIRTHPDFAEAYNEALPYGDIVHYVDSSKTYISVADVVSALKEDFSIATYKLEHVSIEFELDTGQKTDTILTTKQFVETKLVVATLHKFDAFPMQVLVHVDGTPNIVTRDISTDAPFWKSDADVGVLNTNVYGNDTFNTLRQLILRYSGKGKSIRHIITGRGLCNFKLYETYVRYKLLNTKQ